MIQVILQPMLYDQQLPQDSSDTSSDTQKQHSLHQRSKQPIIHPKPYLNDEDHLICKRFPHIDFCLCGEHSPFELVEVMPRLYLSDFNSAMSTKEVLQNKITHILNLSSREYTKRYQYFEYLTIDVVSSNEEDIKKYFRITNRFIMRAMQMGGEVLIHCRNGLEISPCFALAFLIAHHKIPLKAGLEMLGRKSRIEIGSHFLRQLQSYDLQKLAFISIKYKAVV